MLIIFFDINGIVHKLFSCQAKHSIPHTTVAFYVDCVKIYEDFAPNFCEKNWLLHLDNAPTHNLFSPGNS
jgi:hypothetical protein